MIYVTSGFEQGVGLEIFLKAISNSKTLSGERFQLITSKSFLKETANSCKIDINIESDRLKVGNSEIRLTLLDNFKVNLTTDSLELALSNITPDDTLLTLPTKKDQLILNGNVKAGYTEYFRERFYQPNLTMNFLSSTDTVLLLTDHIPLSKVEESITEKLILDRVQTTLKNLPRNREISEVLFSGINPHCGEEGMLGTADQVLKESISKLQKLHPGLIFHEPKAGDTLSFHHKDSTQLFVYAFHDQGLAPFKLKNGLIGINLTLGLPFKRVSVDHGTAPDIFGQNKADARGMMYLIEEIVRW